jgi:hypothetical protein
MTDDSGGSHAKEMDGQISVSRSTLRTKDKHKLMIRIDFNTILTARHTQRKNAC